MPLDFNSTSVIYSLRKQCAILNSALGVEVESNHHASAVLTDALEEIFQKVRRDLGTLEKLEIEPYEKATFATEQKIAGILYPQNLEEVIQIVKIANQRKISLYPIARGKNWGYGSRVPTTSMQIILNLSKMNRILSYDEEQGFLVIEPGVSFQQAYEYLLEKKSKRILNPLGGSPECSMLANALERGIGNGPYTERCNHVCNLQVVLASGQVIETGLGHLTDASCTNLVKSGPGPSLDGLFFQSNLGIVTRLTMYLAPLPEHSSTFTWATKNHSQLPAIVEALRQLRGEGAIHSNATIANDIRMFATNFQYPWDLTHGQTPLSFEQRTKWANETSFGMWNGRGAFYVSSRESRLAYEAQIRDRLGPLVDYLIFFNKENLPDLCQRREEFRRQHKIDIDRLIEAGFTKHLLRGVPSSDSMNQSYWRKKMERPQKMDPDKDECGAIWICPEIPFRGEDAWRVAEIFEKLSLHHGYEPFTSFVTTTERSIKVVGAVIYDRSIPGEDQRAMAYYREIEESFERLGYFPYRLGIQSMQFMKQNQSDYLALLRILKQTLDPNDIFAPGHYIEPLSESLKVK